MNKIPPIGCLLSGPDPCNKAHKLGFVGFKRSVLIQIVYFYKSNAGGIVYTAYNRGVVTRGRSAMIADSLPSCGASRWCDVPTWSLVIIPPIIVVLQLSLEAIKAPVLSCSSNVGSANGLGILYGGHRARDQWRAELPSLRQSLEQ